MAESINSDKLEKQIRETYYNAYFDLLQEKVDQDPPDYEWIVHLYEEIRTKFMTLLKEGGKTRKQIEDEMNVQLFDQMIRNNAFGGPEFHKLTCFVFDLCLQLGSPQRDADTKAKRDEILTTMNAGSKFSILLPMFIKHANTCIDHIYEDLQTTLQ